MKKTRSLVLMALFTALIAVGAFIKIPIPVVPFTLQFLFTMLAGVFLGGKRGAISVICYIIIGLIGLPVFAEGGGIMYVLKPSFGYIIGFVFGTYATGTMIEKSKELSIKNLLIANFTGLIIVYLFGMVYYWCICTFYTGSGIGIWTLILYCFILVVPGDIALCILTAFLGKRLIPVFRKEDF